MRETGRERAISASSNRTLILAAARLGKAAVCVCFGVSSPREYQAPYHTATLKIYLKTRRRRPAKKSF